jgi:hypothetical protein
MVYGYYPPAFPDEHFIRSALIHQKESDTGFRCTGSAEGQPFIIHVMKRVSVGTCFFISDLQKKEQQ